MAMDSVVDIAGLDKAMVLAALTNNALILGNGHLHPQSQQELTVGEARDLLEQQGFDFDYVRGHVVKTDLSADKIDPFYYDRDNGQGKAAEVIDRLKRTGRTDASGMR